MRSFLIIFLLTFQANAFEKIDISSSACSDYILSKYGVSAKNLCVTNESAFYCENEKLPHGAQVPEEFFSKFKINKKNLKISITKRCSQIIQKEIPTLAKNCKLSDHKLFDPLINMVSSAHSCFCETSNNSLTLSICVVENETLQSTGDFDPDLLRKKLNDVCDERIDSNYKIACFCNKYFATDNSKYISCLQKQTLRKEQPLKSLPNKNNQGIK